MTKAAKVPEREFQKTVVALLEALGWANCHTYPLRTEHGWRTGTTAKGWPDLVALRGPVIVAIEVKSDQGRLRPEQLPWLEAFAELECGHAWIVTPSISMQLLASWLQYPQRAPKTHGFQIQGQLL